MERTAEFQPSALMSSRLRFLTLGGETGAVRAVGSGIAISEVVLGITDVVFDKVTEVLLNGMLIQNF
jgi:hypothetical protein